MDVRPDDVALSTFTDCEKSLDSKKPAKEVDLDKHELPGWLRELEG